MCVCDYEFRCVSVRCSVCFLKEWMQMRVIWRKLNRRKAKRNKCPKTGRKVNPTYALLPSPLFPRILFFSPFSPLPLSPSFALARSLALALRMLFLSIFLFVEGKWGGKCAEIRCSHIIFAMLLTNNLRVLTRLSIWFAYRHPFPLLLQYAIPFCRSVVCSVIFAREREVEGISGNRIEAVE